MAQRSCLGCSSWCQGVDLEATLRQKQALMRTSHWVVALAKHMSYALWESALQSYFQI